jgi:predicted permease
MRRLRAWIVRLAGVFRRAGTDRAFAQEIETHVQMHTDDNVRAGMGPSEARRRAVLKLGGIASVTESYRDQRGLAWLETLTQDVRFGVRMLLKHRGFSAAALLTLSLGIGATTGIFTMVDHAMVRPLSYPEAHRLYAVHEEPVPFMIAPRLPVNAMHFQEWRRTTRAFDAMALIQQHDLNLTGTGEPERLTVGRVSPALFRMLGARPQLGRLFHESEDRPGEDNVVILSDALWNRRFGGDPRIVGQTILLNDGAFEIVGVLPPDFRFPKINQLYAMTVTGSRPEIWKPFAVREEELTLNGDYNYACIVRLAPGISREHAKAEVDAAQARIAGQMPYPLELRAALVPLKDQITSRVQAGLELMAAAVGVVLLIGCVNIMNLLLARLTNRQREIAVRRTMGASRGRLVRQLIVENLILALVGGALGIAIAFAALQVLVASAPVDLPRMDEIRIDGRVLLFATGLTMLSALLFGTWPAWKSADVTPQQGLAAGSRSMTACRSHFRVRSVLVGVEVALTTLCLVAGGLLLHSFVKLLRVDKGFETSQTLFVSLNLPESRYSEVERRAGFLRGLLEGLGRIPQIESAGVINRLPLSGEGGNSILTLEDKGGPSNDIPAIADVRGVNRDYFRTMGIPLRSGEIFSEAHRGQPVVLVSALTAERLWPRSNAVGKRLRIGPSRHPWRQVIGVVGDVRGVSLDKTPSATVYLPYWDPQTWGIPSLVVGTTASVPLVAPLVRSVIQELDASVPIGELQSLDAAVTGSVAPRRFQMMLVLLFAALASLLACIGVYGVVSYWVAQRVPEIGVRIALGAEPATIHRLVIRQGLLPVVLGLLAGLVLSMGADRVLGSLLFGITARDPLTMVAAAMALLLVAVAAIHLPARRAMRIEPVAALREE